MIERDDRGDVRVLRMEHGKASALDVELLSALREEFEAFAGSPARSAVLVGTGTIFCAGLDLKRLVQGGARYVRELLPVLESSLAALFTCSKPVVAAINGHAIAGGYILACACDRRLMAAGDGKVGLPELHVGVPFPTLVMEVLRSALPPQRLQEMLLVGGTHAAQPALAAGLVDEVVHADDLLAMACASAERLGRLAPQAYALTKRKLREPAVEAWRRRSAGGDAEIVEQWCSPDTLAAIERFVGRKLP